MKKWGWLAAILVVVTVAGTMLYRMIHERNLVRQTAASLARMNMLGKYCSAENAFGLFSARNIVDDNGKPLLSWRVAALKYFDKTLYDQFHLNEPWDSPHNRALIERMPDEYRSMGSNANKDNKTNYLLATGPGTLLPAGEPFKEAQLKRTGSSVIAIVEVDDDQAVVWTKPEDYLYSVDNPRRGLGGLRGKGFLSLFMGGNCQLIDNEVRDDMVRWYFDPTDGRELEQ